MYRLSGLATGVGALAGMLFVALQFGLFVGGISYRKDCLTASGAVKSDWSFTWFAPIPYVFRPSQAGCEIHTGTRVVLNSLGVGRFSSPTTASLAKKASMESDNDQLAYFGQLKASIVEYQNESATVADIDAGQKLLNKILGELDQLEPPTKYAAVQGRLIQLFRDTESAGREAQAAVDAGDQEALAAVSRRIRRMDPPFRSIIAEFNRLHSTD
jgi:hypothetical protein